MHFSKHAIARYERGVAAASARPILSAVAATVLTVGARLTIDRIAPGVSPYALVFVAVTLVTLVAGARSGLLAILLCQTLIWFFVVPRIESGIGEAAQIISLVLTTFSQLIIIWSLGLYRDMAEERCRREQLERQHAELAMRELDHRTKNSFQLATSVLRARAAHIDAPELRAELDRAAQRLISLESAHSNDAVSRGTASTVALDAYVNHMVERLGDGLEGLAVEFVTDVPPMTVPRRIAMSLGLMLNECIFNSVKHAFGDDGGRITITAKVECDALVVEIRDDGPGFDSDRGGGVGIGGRLIEAVARSIHATISRLPGAGAGYRITLPLEPAGTPQAAPRQPFAPQRLSPTLVQLQ